MEETTPPSPLDRALHAGRWVLFALMAAAFVPPLLKVTGVIEWSWPAALAPLTASGVVASGFVLLVFVVQGSRWVRNRLGGGDAGALTPPPERLEPPRGAEEAGERTRCPYDAYPLKRHNDHARSEGGEMAPMIARKTWTSGNLRWLDVSVWKVGATMRGPFPRR